MTPSQAPEQAPPVCYRHAGKVSRVRCVRCDRPICGDCQIPASVGFQCPECVKAGAKTIRVPKGTFGGTVARVPLVTRALIGINVVLFVVTAGYQLSLNGSEGYSQAFIDLALIPTRLRIGTGNGTSTVVDGVAHGEYYRLVTSMFLHFGFVHIALNMFMLYVSGPVVERILGHWRFALVYLAGGFAGLGACLRDRLDRTASPPARQVPSSRSSARTC